MIWQTQRVDRPMRVDKRTAIGSSFVSTAAAALWAVKSLITRMSANRNRSSRSSSSSNVSCTICSERYKASDQIYGGSCGHVFHWQCLQRWWEESNSCPVCRNRGQEFFQLYLSFEEAEQSQSQSQSQSHTSEADDLTSEFQNLLYESDLYRDEIKYLNTQIRLLKVKMALSSYSASDSE